MNPEVKKLLDVKLRSVQGLDGRDVVIAAREIRTLCEELLALEAELDKRKSPPVAPAEPKRNN